MSTVVELDKIKDRMLVTEKKLKQADNWCVLNDQIDLLFEEQVLYSIHFCTVFVLVISFVSVHLSLGFHS